MGCGEAAAAGGGFFLLLRGILLLLGVCNALSLEIKVSPKVRAFVGEQVTLKCSFKSSSPITESLTIDWTYRPFTSGQMETIFHYQSVPYPTTVGKFKDRISWVGNVAKGDASIAIQSPVMSDNGTFICSVRNPPDAYHNIPQTMLVVVERGLSFQLTSATLLSILVFLPSVIVVVLLLVRMGRKFGVLKEKKKSGCKKSSIEVPECTERDNCLGKLRNWCLNCTNKMKMLLILTLVLTWLERGSGSTGWVFMEPQLRASTGDSVLLQCLFLDSVTKGWIMDKVDWLRMAGPGTQKEEMVFYYYSNRSVPVGRFRDRVQWQGNISHWDGSIQLQNVQVNDSGTYMCEIRLLENGSIFKNYTVLHISPVGQRGRGAAHTQDAAAPGDTWFWPVTVGCCCVAIVLAFLAGLCLRKRSAANTALERIGNGGSKNKAEEALYSSIPGAELPKAEQDAGKKKRAEETYVTMRSSPFQENGVYVELAKRVIPAEWMGEGRQGDGQSQEPYSLLDVALPWAPEGRR
ncbi:junctional adhesion molecule-like [Limosa lapponica baueri]|uniref:Junctional adhesion molecule-like n=1 Tax=Limosa lapponica baueri TaxID=1758121 RepID=A0A2I0TUW0_LIMLA|nr:junctional adhesion molecule-like [Limosa lapponica baueri]